MYCYNYQELKTAANTESGKAYVEKIKEIYETEYEKEPIPLLNYSYAKLYYQTGDRNKYQSLYFARRKRLEALQILAIYDDKYLEPLEEIISAICDEYTWVLPAHNLLKEKEIFDPTVIDLYSSETGLYLAETAYIFGEKLSNDIKYRIKYSLEQKIVKNYESRTHVFDGLINNWAAVCATGVGLTYLYAFPERFPLIEKRIFGTLKSYLVGIDDDGYCREGMGYWGYGFGFFCIFMDAYSNLTGKKHEFLELDKVKNAAEYYNKTNLGGGEFLPFADGGVRQIKISSDVVYTVKNLFPDKIKISEKLPVYLTGKALGLRTLLGVAKYQIEDKKAVEVHYYENSQVFIYKTNNYSFAAKGGVNPEPHGHCDVGAFQIVKDGKRLICDPGAGEYTYGYFNIQDDSYEGRYGEKIFVCSSYAHSVPILGGNPQPFNLSNAKAVVVERSDQHIKMDIAATYRNMPEKLEVCYQMEEHGISVKYNYKGNDKVIIFRFVSDFEPVIKDGVVYIEGMRIENKNGLLPKISSKGYSPHVAKLGNDPLDYAYLIDYKVEREGEINVEFAFVL